MKILGLLREEEVEGRFEILKIGNLKKKHNEMSIMKMKEIVHKKKI